MRYSEEQRQSIEKCLIEGFSVSSTALQLGLNYYVLYKYVRKEFISWDRSWRDSKKCRNSNYGKRSKLKLSVEEILKRYREGRTLELIGQEANCSKEYIRQIVVSQGYLSVRAKNRKRKEQIRPYCALVQVLVKYAKKKRLEEIKEQRYEKLLEHWRLARELCESKSDRVFRIMLMEGIFCRGGLDADCLPNGDWYLSRLIVKPQWRSHGLGGKMIRMLKAYVTTRIIVHPGGYDMEQEKIESFYRYMGFIETEEGFIWKRGNG